MTRETRVQSQVELYQRLKKWYLMPPYLTLSIIRYGSRIKRSNLGAGVVPSPKGSLLVALDYGWLSIYIYLFDIFWLFCKCEEQFGRSECFCWGRCKVTNHAEKWEASLPNTLCMAWSTGSESMDFWLRWAWLIVEVLATIWFLFCTFAHNKCFFVIASAVFWLISNS